MEDARIMAGTRIKETPTHTTAASRPSVQMVDNLQRRRIVGHIMAGLFGLATLISVGILMVIVYDIAREGLQAIDWNFLTRARRFIPADGGRVNPQESGIAHAIQGTLIMTGTAALLAVPLGLLTAIYLSEYGRGRFADVVRFVIDLMLQMPSIVIGIFVWSTLVQVWGFSGRAGAVALALVLAGLFLYFGEFH